MDWLINQWGQIFDYLAEHQILETVGLATVRIILILFGAWIITRIGKGLILKLFMHRKKGPFTISERREATLTKLLENTLVYMVYFTAFIMILESLGLQVGALLAGAGIAGLAIGFGAQNLVKDIITGFFIIFEDQFSVGDFVRIGQSEGVVDEIGLRTTKIKTWTGEHHIIPNGNIQEVINFSIHNSVAVVDVGVSYEGDINLAEKVLTELLERLPADNPEMVKTPELLGVQNLGASDVVFRVIAEVEPMQHWAIARKMRKAIKEELDKNGVEIPFPRLVMYSRKEKEEDLVKE
ncbi:small conductance mechanosensitive channel [Salirhabdus euzebyi]|uniref:Small conductance mechanosensitive channel n=1 Tax=Salirhabdus euzebyi TaxID=394506 RepID=A0A841Q7R1_9BACI|nr:mechanosensitive ion channel family protein [Salirhabdus euzebyi]MBB6454436.1 small conductance mechanosensitive channel [Salirhabdus euzebyi]